jgi:hypothetical protein
MRYAPSGSNRNKRRRKKDVGCVSNFVSLSAAILYSPKSRMTNDELERMRKEDVDDISTFAWRDWRNP